jgi:opine dehydrogenase
VRERGAIDLTDHAGTRVVRIAKVATDPGEALAGAELIVVPAPATAQEDIARAIAPHLADGQVVFLPPGTFGSYLMSGVARAAGSRARVTFAEAGTLPYLARKRGPSEIAITIRAVRLPTGVYPAARAGEALGVIRVAYPSVQPCGDALSGALINAGPIIHPPLILMNAAPLEGFERWDIHNEGTQPSVRAVTDRLDGERIALREALGLGAPHFPLADHYTSDRWMYGDAHRKLVDSGDWRERVDLRAHRYMTEDTVLGLAFLVSVARWAKHPTPVAEGLLAIAGAILGRDLCQGPRTLEALGMASLDRSEMTQLLYEGRR